MAPLFLGIDTATALGGVALVGADGVVAEYAADVKGSHAPRLMGAVERLLDVAGVALPDLAGIGVSIGPGSFTGLRVGVATAMGLARGGNVPVFPVPTLEVVARAVPRPQGALVAVALTARRGEVYSAVYQAAGDHVPMTAVIHPIAVSPETLMSDLIALEQPVVVAGSGAMDVVTVDAPARVTVADPVYWHPKAAEVAWRARGMAEAGEIHPQLTPFYLKASQAEISWAERQRQGGA